MSKERYQTQQQLLDVVRRFRADHFPLDYIVQDWQYWGGVKNDVWDGKWSGMVWDAERFPDPAAMTRELHEKHKVKLMASIWPSVGNDTALAQELDAKGLRFAPLHWISKRARIYDAFSAEGRRIYFKHTKKGLLDVGVDALMDGRHRGRGGWRRAQPDRGRGRHQGPGAQRDGRLHALPQRLQPHDHTRRVRRPARRRPSWQTRPDR